MTGGRPEVSVVVPVYRTAWALPELVRRIGTVAAAHGWEHEVVLVDDASPDDAREVAGRLAADPRVRAVSLPENRGQHRAVLAGIQAARGDWVVVMDGDLQDPPEAIPELLAHARGGAPRFDAVFAARVNRYQAWHRMLTSRLFKRALARRCGLPPGSGMFFVASRRLAERLETDDPDPFVVAMVGLAGLPVSSLPVARAERLEGRSAYSSWRRLRAGVSALSFAARHRRALAGEGRAPSSPPGVAAGVALSAGLLAFAAALAAVHGRPFDLGDEGFRYLLSRAWADGADLFETFRLHYVPGQYVWFGTCLSVFGPSVETVRAAEAVVSAAGVAALVWAVARVAPPGLAAAAGAAVACVAVRGHATAASALVFAAALGLARRRAEGRAPSGAFVAATAVLAGLLAGWREDSAVLALVVAAIAVTVRRRPRDLALRLLPGALAGFAVWVALFAGRGQAPELIGFVSHRLGFLVERLAAPVRPGWSPPADPFASPRDLVSAAFPVLAALPLVVYLAVLGWQGLRARRGRPVSWPAIGAALAAAAYLPQFLWERPDVAHLRSHLHLTIAAAAVAAAALAASRPGGGRRLRGAAAAGLVLLAAAGFAYGLRRPAEGATLVYPSQEGRRIGALTAPPAPPWAGTLDGGGLIVLGWGPGWYALEGKPPATRFLYTQKRSLRSAEQAAELMADVEDPAVRWLIVDGSPTADAPEIGVRARELYAPVARWGRWQLRERVERTQ